MRKPSIRSLQNRLKSRNLHRHIATATLILSAFTAMNASACTLKDKRICSIDSELRLLSGGHQVNYSENSTSSSNIISEAEWIIGANDVVHLGDTALYDYDDLFFSIAHEYFHSLSRHARLMLESVASEEDKTLNDNELFNKYQSKIGNVTRELNHAQEFAADTYAVKLMHKTKRDPIASMRRILQNTSSSKSHPSRRSRIESAKAIIEQLSDVEKKMAST